MKSNHQFIIPFKGLKIGRHEFKVEVDSRFFDIFPESEMKKGEVTVDIFLTKRENMLELEFELYGKVWVVCDRCLDEFQLPIEYDTKLYVKFGDVTEEQTDEIILLSYGESEIDISQYIYEYIQLSLPYRKIHPLDENGESLCNKDMIKKLNEFTTQEKSEENNPEWDELKNFLKNNN